MSTKPMRAILIDPHNKTITELDIQPGYDAIKQTIEAPIIDRTPLCKDIDMWIGKAADRC
jgi:hypothetical protein